MGHRWAACNMNPKYKHLQLNAFAANYVNEPEFAGTLFFSLPRIDVIIDGRSWCTLQASRSIVYLEEHVS